MNNEEAGKEQRQRFSRADDAAAVLTALLSGLLCYVVYQAYHSQTLTMLSALACGGVGVALLPLRAGESISDADKRKWLVWFAPALVVEAIALAYVLRAAAPNSDVLGSSGLAWIFGATAAGTYRVLRRSES